MNGLRQAGMKLSILKMCLACAPRFLLRRIFFGGNELGALPAAANGL
jgi:hypothetical protein